MKVIPNAPRFHSLWESIEEARIFAMLRSDWDALAINENELVLISSDVVELLPFGSVLKQSQVLACTVKVAGNKGELKIYRSDPKDAPALVNVDTYMIWMELPAFPYLDVPKMIREASTDSDENFNLYRNHVFCFKEKPGEGHWLAGLPKEVEELQRKTDK